MIDNCVLFSRLKGFVDDLVHSLPRIDSLAQCLETKGVDILAKKRGHSVNEKA